MLICVFSFFVGSKRSPCNSSETIDAGRFHAVHQPRGRSVGTLSVSPAAALGAQELRAAREATWGAQTPRNTDRPGRQPSLEGPRLGRRSKAYGTQRAEVGVSAGV